MTDTEKYRDQLMAMIEGYTGTLETLAWDKISVGDMEKLLAALKHPVPPFSR